MNILFLIIDALRYDFIGYARSFSNTITPNLDQISREGLTYNYAFSTGTSTPFSFPGILASIYAHQSKGEGIRGAPLTSAEFFRNKGYITIGLNGGNIYVSNIYGYERGMDYLYKYYSISGNRSSARRLIKNMLVKLGLKEKAMKVSKYKNTIKRVLFNIPYIYRARDQIETFLDIVKENSSKRFFAFINFMEVHGPYIGLWKAPIKERILLEKLVKMRSFETTQDIFEFNKYAYSRGLEIVDQELGYLLNILDSRGILKETVVVITSDHGEEFLEHGNYDHHPKPFDEIIRVPLIVFIKKENFSSQDKTMEKEKLVSLIDVVPSVLKYIFGEMPKEFMGKNVVLGGNEKRDYIFSEGFRRIGDLRHDHTKKGIHNWCIRTKKWKFMELDGKKYVFDMMKDPKELKPTMIKNVSDLKPEIREVLERFNKEKLKYKIKNKLL